MRGESILDPIEVVLLGKIEPMLGARSMHGRRYPPELRELAIRMVRTASVQEAGQAGLIPRIARQLGVGVGSLRDWVRQAEIEVGEPGVRADEAAQPSVALERTEERVPTGGGSLSQMRAARVATGATPRLRHRRALSLQIRDQLRILIAEGGLRPGDRLPSEAALAQRFSVARPTLREALKLLEQGGELDVRHGLGWFVAHATGRWPITRLETVAEMLHAMGSSVTTRLVSGENSEASEEEGAALGQVAGSRVIRVTRIRLLDGRPTVYSIDVIAGWVLEEDIATIDWTGSLRTLLDTHCAPMASAHAQIQAVSLPRGPALEMREDRGAPWLLLTQTQFTSDGRPVMFSHEYHRGDTVTFDVVRRWAES